MNRAPFPRRIGLELAATCNLSCPMCPRRVGPPLEGLMEPSLWYDCVEEILERDKETILLPFWRGESLMHPHFIPLLSHALKLGARVHLSTNALLLGEAEAELLAQMEFVTFSIHEERGWERARAFARRRDRRCTTQASFVSCEQSVQRWLPLLLQDRLQGFDSVRLYEEHTQGGVYGAGGAAAEEPRVFCPKLEGTLMVAFDGRIARCNHLWEVLECSVLEGGIARAWNAPALLKVGEHYPDAGCAACDQWSGHTRGRAWRREGEEVVEVEYP